MPSPALANVARHYQELYIGRPCTLNGMPARICTHTEFAAVIVGPTDEPAVANDGSPLHKSAVFSWLDVRKVMEDEDRPGQFSATPYDYQTKVFTESGNAGVEDRYLLPAVTIQNINLDNLHGYILMIIYQMMYQAMLHGQYELGYKLALHIVERRTTYGEPVPYMYTDQEFDGYVHRVIKHVEDGRIKIASKT